MGAEKLEIPSPTLKERSWQRSRSAHGHSTTCDHKRPHGHPRHQGGPAPAPRPGGKGMISQGLSVAESSGAGGAGGEEPGN